MRQLHQMDYKERIQYYADEIAQEEYNKDNFYELTKEQQEIVWKKAEEKEADYWADIADSLVDEEKLSGKPSYLRILQIS